MSDEQKGGRVFHVDTEASAVPSEREGEQPSGAPTVAAMTFAHHVLSLNHLALVHLGEPPEATGPAPVDLVLAAQVIDTLAMLKDKTVGNLDAEEIRLLDTLLYELRVKYVQKARR